MKEQWDPHFLSFEKLSIYIRYIFGILDEILWIEKFFILRILVFPIQTNSIYRFFSKLVKIFLMSMKLLRMLRREGGLNEGSTHGLLYFHRHRRMFRQHKQCM